MPNRTLEQRLADHEERLECIEKELQIQFKRIAQLQAELDQKRMATDSVKLVIETFSEKAD
jgi:hypothetical protein